MDYTFFISMLSYTALASLVAWAFASVTWGFFPLLVFRYLRLIVHLISFWCYRPSPVLKEPTFTADDVTVIIPTVDPNDNDLLLCLESILLNRPREIRIVTVGEANLQSAEEKAARFRAGFPSVKITVSAISSPGNKRKQVASVLPDIRTAITISADASVCWPNNQFIPAVIAPLEDPKVGAVAPHKRVHRLGTDFSWKSFWNFMGCLYLQRHNWELRASNAVDDGLFVISGRTAVFRTEILQDPDFLHEYLNEKMFFGLLPIPNVDDDNFVTRWLVTKGWKMKFQEAPNSTMEVLTLGTWPKFFDQLKRWSRTTIRSNTASLLTERTVYRAQPWSVYAVYLTGLTNFALFWDPLILWTLSKTSFYSKETMTIMVVWILMSKLFKLLPHFYRHPADLIYLPGYYVFAYAHSLIKLYSVLTFWKTNWGGRNLDTEAGNKPALTAADFIYNADSDSDYESTDGSRENAAPEGGNHQLWLSFLNHLPPTVARLFSRVWSPTTAPAVDNSTNANDSDPYSPNNDLSDLERWWARNLELAAEEEREEVRKEIRFRRRYLPRKSITVGKGKGFNKAAPPPAPV